jgi:sec-independent protein translocase protein TatA
MIGDLFDSPWKILIVAVVLIVLFGSKKLPDAARSLGKSMRILKAEVQDLHGNDETPAVPPMAQPSAAIPATQPAQPDVEALQAQLRDLQAKAAAAEPARGSAPAAETHHTQHTQAG